METVSAILKASGPETLNTLSAAIAQSSEHVPPACPLCFDHGWLHPLKENGKPDYSSVKRCGCKAESDRRDHENSLKRYCEFPVGCEGMTFENYKGVNGLSEAVQTARDVAREQGPVKWLTLQGKVGRGKTHLAVAICREWLARGRAARYAFVPLMLKELRDAMKDESYKLRFQTFLDVPMLVLDDLGTEKASEWVTEQLTTIIDYRAMHGLYLVVTTNKALNDLPGDDEYRIGSRLRRYPWCKVAILDGPEYGIQR